MKYLVTITEATTKANAPKTEVNLMGEYDKFDSVVIAINDEFGLDRKPCEYGLHYEEHTGLFMIQIFPRTFAHVKII